MIQRTVAALSAAHGPVLHVRLHVTVASPDHPSEIAWSGDTDEWIDETGPQHYRMRTTFPNLPRPVETGGDYRGSSPTYVYDSADDTLYYVPLYGSGFDFVDPVTQAKRSLRPAPAVTVRKIGDTYRIEDDRNIRRPSVLVVDATTYRPIRESWTVSSGGGPPYALYSQRSHAPLSALWQTINEYVTYEYVDDHTLASIRAHFPHAKIGLAPEMPKAFKRQFQPWTGP